MRITRRGFIVRLTVRLCPLKRGVAWRTHTRTQKDAREVRGQGPAPEQMLAGGNISAPDHFCDYAIR